MPEQLTGELLALRDRAAQFAGWLANAQDRREVITAAREAGFLQMTQPRQYGGSAAGLLALTVVRDALASRNPPFLDAVFGPAPGVLAGCSEPLASDYLQPMLRGELRAAFGFTEPEENPTTGRLDADRLTVNGCKSYVTGGADADFINTLVRIDSMGPALVVIDSNAPGVHMTERFESLDGSHHAAFAFDGVVVPANRIIGKPGEGLPRAMGPIVDTRLAISANCVGWARWIVEHTTRHLETLDRNGKARGDRESVRLRYADMRMHSRRAVCSTVPPAWQNPAATSSTKASCARCSRPRRSAALSTPPCNSKAARRSSWVIRWKRCIAGCARCVWRKAHPMCCGSTSPGAHWISARVRYRPAPTSAAIA